MTNEFSIRTDRFYSESGFLFGELYPGESSEFPKFQEILKAAYQARPANLRRRDRNALDNPEWYKRTSGSRKRKKAARSTLLKVRWRTRKT